MEYTSFEEQEQIKIVDNYFAEKQYDKIMNWAYKNYASLNSKVISEKVVECYRICVEQNMPYAALNLGCLYYNGLYIKRDFKKAFELYKIAADTGDVRAICNISYCYYYGRHQEVDYNLAFKYFSIGALVYNDANCIYKLGDMYLNGFATEKNEMYALQLYRNAYYKCSKRYVGEREDGDGYEYENPCLGDVELRLGKCFLNGIGVAASPMMAQSYLSKSLSRFYERRKSDPFAMELIEQTKKLICQAQKILDNEVVEIDEDR